MGFAYTSKAAASVAPSVPTGYPPGWDPPPPPTPGPPGPYPPGYPKPPAAVGDKLAVTIDPDLLHGPDGTSVTVVCKTVANANTNAYLGQLLQLVCVDADNMPVDMRLSLSDSYESVLAVAVSFLDPEYGWTGTIYFDTTTNGDYTLVANVMAVAPTVGGAADWTDANTAAVPTITPADGAATNPQSFTVTSPDGGQVTVTDDGTDPLTSGTARLEDSPYTFSHAVPCTIKAFSVVPGKVDSGVVTWDYVVGIASWTITERWQGGAVSSYVPPCSEVIHSLAKASLAYDFTDAGGGDHHTYFRLDLPVDGTLGGTIRATDSPVDTYSYVSLYAYHAGGGSPFLSVDVKRYGQDDADRTVTLTPTAFVAGDYLVVHVRKDTHVTGETITFACALTFT